MAHAVAILVVSPQGIPLVRDMQKPSPWFWKMPGGKSESGETPEQTAQRELREETGIDISLDDSNIIFEEDRGTHMFYLFVVSADIKGLKEKGDEGEEIKIFAKKDILSLKDILPPHAHILQITRALTLN